MTASMYSLQVWNTHNKNRFKCHMTFQAIPLSKTNYSPTFLIVIKIITKYGKASNVIIFFIVL